MILLETRVLLGPNRWAPVPVLESRVDCREWAQSELDQASPFRQRWREWIPVFATLVGQTSPLAKGFVGSPPHLLPQLEQALASSANLAEILELCTRLLQSLAGVGAQFGETRQTEVAHIYLVAVESEEQQFDRACLKTARDLCLSAAHEEPFDLMCVVRDLITLADDVRLGPSSLAIVRAAMARGIPAMRLNRGSLVQLGEGCHQRRVWTAETDATSAIAESIAQDKDLTKRLLQAVGVPVPRGRPVLDAEDAWQAATEVGLPITVKPRRANHARGISLDLYTREETLSAFDWAVEDGENTGVLVEQYIPGSPHRLLVVGGQLIAAASGEPEYVVGDGQLTIAELVEQLNSDPLRGENYADRLSLVALDAAALMELRRQSFEPESIPPDGVRILIQRVGDLTSDCTANVHPTTVAQAVLAAKVVGLDVAGIDLIAEDIRRPLNEQRGAILEVNAGPSLGMHVAPLHGTPQPVGEAIINQLFPSNSNGRVLTIIVTGGGDRPSVTRRIAETLREVGHQVGWASSSGIYFNEIKISDGSESDGENLWALRLHPRIEVMICESRPDQVLNSGLGCPHVDIAVVTSLPIPDDGRLLEEIQDPTILGTLAIVAAVPPEGIVVFWA